ncbi:hypothetical protein ACLOJK_001537 [Asimina triloba]
MKPARNAFTRFYLLSGIRQIPNNCRLALLTDGNHHHLRKSAIKTPPCTTPSMDEEQEETGVIEAIDRLWIWENILSKTPTTHPRIQQIPPPIPSSSCTPLSKDNCLTTPPAAPINSIRQSEPVITSDFQSCSVSPSTKEHPSRRKAKMRRHKSLSELENEELKGFTDLGFIFNRNEASPYERSILPGLQTPEEKTIVSRPYLSEAWLINRPDSPLLNLRIPATSAASGADMKKHLRTWARMVASSVELDFSGDTSHT